MDQRKAVYFAYVQSVCNTVSWHLEGYSAGKILETFGTTQRTKIKDTQKKYKSAVHKNSLSSYKIR